MALTEAGGAWFKRVQDWCAELDATTPEGQRVRDPRRRSSRTAFSGSRTTEKIGWSSATLIRKARENLDGSIGQKDDSECAVLVSRDEQNPPGTICVLPASIAWAARCRSVAAEVRKRRGPGKIREMNISPLRSSRRSIKAVPLRITGRART